ncbi:MAG TPA: hypothetical protein PKE00_14975, partial [Planctomycetota bacterium]|nr:hypothetical protein [Planctomycetota bacterium]
MVAQLDGRDVCSVAIGRCKGRVHELVAAWVFAFNKDVNGGSARTSRERCGVGVLGDDVDVTTSNVAQTLAQGFLGSCDEDPADALR